MTPPSSGSLSRRRFLTVAGGAAAGALLLGACGDDDGGSVSSEGGDDDGTTTTAVGGAVALAQFFGGPMFAAGEPVRAPFGVSDTEGLLPTDDTPEQPTLKILDPDGEEVDSAAVSPSPAALATAYFPTHILPPAH